MNRDGSKTGPEATGDRSAWSWAALMPHPPVMVPEVGQGREQEAARTLAGARSLTDRLQTLPDNGRPDLLLILSPHQPYVPGALFLNNAPLLKGGLGRFGAPGVKFSLPTSPMVEDLAAALDKAGLPVVSGPVPDLTPDHGSTVPLYFLAKALGPLPPVIVGSPIGLSPAQALALGRTLAGLKPGGGRWALLASGDLSHRLLPEAPAGFDPEGPRLDKDIISALAQGDPERLLRDWPPSRLSPAGECGFRSVLALLGLVGGPLEVLSYEGPFGVGYGNALWINGHSK